MKKNSVEDDIVLTFDFLRYLIDHPEMADDIPDGAEVEFIGSDIVTTEPAEDTVQGSKRTVIATRRIFEFPPAPPASSRSS